ncbi:imidazolonepropionase [Candidatus Acetothermia bacterium]|nr:imidazolonepropionase [Candidatus Acetothermia bacterium]MBI3643163.1 imidazolonepropionase [Candidatus Acetothermia bacterium]
MFVINIGQLVTPQGSKGVSGEEMKNLTILEDAYIQIVNGQILSMGMMSELPKAMRDRTLDAKRGVVIPGLIDPHTHAAFYGSREEEFLARCLGEPYGKGILTSMNLVRAATDEQIYQYSRRFLLDMISRGTTTVEIKSGYGLNTEGELKLLKVIKRLKANLPIEVVPTFLGAHAIPEGVKKEDYVGEIVEKMIPQVVSHRLAEFCDIFCERGFFSISDSREVLKAASSVGLKLKLHAEEFQNSQSAELSAELKATSADHLLFISSNGMYAMLEAGVIPVLLPGTAFTLNLNYAPAREMIDMGLPVALGTDFNPGTCLVHSMLLILSLAVMKMKMSVEEALTAATLNAAAALDRAGITGSLEEGKRGDLVVLDLKNYRQIPYFFGHGVVHAVVASGKIIYERESGLAAN